MSEQEPGCLENPCIMEGYTQYLIDCNKMPQARADMYINLVRKFHNHVGKPYVDIKEADVRGYLSFLTEDAKLKNSSAYIHLLAITKFYKYLHSRGEVSKNPMDGFKIKKRRNSSSRESSKRKYEAHGC